MSASKPAPPTARALDEALARLQALSTRELSLQALAGIDALAESVLGPKARREERLLSRIEALEQRAQRERDAERETSERLRGELARELAARVQELGASGAARAALERELREGEARAQLLAAEHARLEAELRAAARAVSGWREKLLPAELRAQLERWRKENP